MFCEWEYRQKGKDAFTHRHHAHTDRVEIIQVLQGEGQVLIRDTLYPMTPGAMYLIDGTETHVTAPVNPETYMRSKLMLSREALIRISGSMNLNALIGRLFFQNSGTYCPLGEEKAREADALFKFICRAHAGEAPEKDFSMWSRFFALMSIAAEGRPAAQTGNELMDQILAFINAHICERLTLDEISRNVHIDKYYMCHYFRNKTNMTVMDYISDRRINMARRLLADSGLTVTEIAAKCGYSGVSYFTQAFKSILKMTPTGYRKQLLKTAPTPESKPGGAEESAIKFSPQS